MSVRVGDVVSLEDPFKIKHISQSRMTSTGKVDLYRDSDKRIKGSTLRLMLSEAEYRRREDLEDGTIVRVYYLFKLQRTHPYFAVKEGIYEERVDEEVIEEDEYSEIREFAIVQLEGEDMEVKNSPWLIVHVSSLVK